MDNPKTLAQYQAEANRQPDGGWACPRCGCKDLRGEDNSGVESTRNPNSEQVIRRRRICRHCGQHVMVTKEVPCPPGFKIVVVPEDEYDERAVA